MLLDQFDGLGGSLAIAVNEVVPFRLNNDKRIPADNRLLSVGISFERLADTSRLPLRTGTIESLGPRERVVSSVVEIRVDRFVLVLNTSRYAHVVDLADARGVVTVVLEVLCPSGAITDLWPRSLVTQHTGCVRIVARHERSS